ncbi:hypothetical protein Fcan01_18724 [Folsomia candida]|uniref:Cilia- and flagella-associated protein 300 n=1 Tax=Folsomia candida TaxID=158441 RepID=A0A226DMB2_FOLCA|nr:hypothetical protein Fcan01_18724 [Folsomia candida]
MEFAGRYGFQHLPLEKFPCWENKEIKEKLTKWSMLDGIRLKAYSFTRPFKDYLHEEFIKKFFACPVVTSTFETANNFKFAPIGTPAELVKFSKVSCTHTTMELFDKLTQNEAIVRQCGGIVQCAPEYTILTTLIPPLARSSELEIEPDLENVFSSEDTKEFLFQLFAHLVLGGSLCQYEDYITQYLEVTKVLYKNLVSVMLTPEEEGLSVVSSIFKIHSISNPAFSRGQYCAEGGNLKPPTSKCKEEKAPATCEDDADVFTQIDSSDDGTASPPPPKVTKYYQDTYCTNFAGLVLYPGEYETEDDDPKFYPDHAVPSTALYPYRGVEPHCPSMTVMKFISALGGRNERQQLLEGKIAEDDIGRFWKPSKFNRSPGSTNGHSNSTAITSGGRAPRRRGQRGVIINRYSKHCNQRQSEEEATLPHRKLQRKQCKKHDVERKFLVVSKKLAPVDVLKRNSSGWYTRTLHSPSVCDLIFVSGDEMETDTDTHLDEELEEDKLWEEDFLQTFQHQEEHCTIARTLLTATKAEVGTLAASRKVLNILMNFQEHFHMWIPTLINSSDGDESESGDTGSDSYGYYGSKCSDDLPGTFPYNMEK